MEERPLYTIILAHFNQYNYIFTALDSILKQSYQAIEIIVMDDCSDFFDKEEILAYINKHKQANIKSVQVLVNEENAGTVRSMNRALKAANGVFVQMFAADDRLNNDEVAESFVSEFEKLGDGAEMLCALAMKMDENLTPPGEYHMAPRRHDRFNAMSAREQYERMAFNCDWAMGAICARTEMYKRMGYFSESYKYIEDWPFYMHITRNGVKGHAVGFKALDHRDGGISRTLYDADAPYAKQYQNDVLTAIETEIFPYLNTFPIQAQDDLVKKYNIEYQTLINIDGTRKKVRLRDLYKYSKEAVGWRLLSAWCENNNDLIKKAVILVYAMALVLFITFGLRSGAFPLDIQFPWAATIVQAGLVLSCIGLVCSIILLIANLIAWIAFRTNKTLKTIKART